MFKGAPRFITPLDDGWYRMTMLNHESKAHYNLIAVLAAVDDDSTEGPEEVILEVMGEGGLTITFSNGPGSPPRGTITDSPAVQRARVGQGCPDGPGGQGGPGGQSGPDGQSGAGGADDSTPDDDQSPPTSTLTNADNQDNTGDEGDTAQTKPSDKDDAEGGAPTGSTSNNPGGGGGAVPDDTGGSSGAVPTSTGGGGPTPISSDGDSNLLGSDSRRLPSH